MRANKVTSPLKLRNILPGRSPGVSPKSKSKFLGFLRTFTISITARPRHVLNWQVNIAHLKERHVYNHDNRCIFSQTKSSPTFSS